MAIRVELCAPAERDREPFLAAMRASAASHAPWNAPPVTDEAFDALLRRARDERFDCSLLRRTGDGAIIGYFNVSEIVRGNFQSAFLGYAAVAEHAGQGYMSEGLVLVLARVFGPLQLHRLEANIQPGNARSLALVRRGGFVNEGYSERYLKIAGRWRDHERWAIRTEQWRARGGTRAPSSRGAS